MSLKLNSSGGGSVTLQEPTTASNVTLNLPAADGTVVSTASTAVVTPAMLTQPLTSGTAIASTSGTALDFTSIPSWVKRITVMFSGVSTNGSSQPLFQLGDSGGIETTGYATATSSISTDANAAVAYTNGWQTFTANASRIAHGAIVFSLLNPSTNTWVGSGQFVTTDVATTQWCSGSKSLSDTLTQVRITTVNGTDTFDAGTINILYEG
jgi:hypothetical protein